MRTLKHYGIGFVEVKISKLNKVEKYHAINPKDPEGQNFSYHWERVSGLGFLPKEEDYGFSAEECLNDAQETINKAFGSEYKAIELI